MLTASRYSSVITLIVVLFATSLFVQCSARFVHSRASTTDLSSFSTPIPCSSLNVTELKVLTFDLFGALMLTDSSLEHSIGTLLPSLSKTDVEKFADLWLDAYGSYFGKSFPASETHQPFLWVIHSSLIDILKSFGLSDKVPEGSATFNSLLSAWGNLQPREGAVEVLTKLGAKYQLGLLSNGDEGTLRSALRVFPSSVNVSLILSSDYPTNCFKACPAMYAQALNAVQGDLKQVMHVAGSAFDTNGARRFGIYSGALDRSAAHTFPPPCFAFDDIKQLPSFFGL